MRYGYHGLALQVAEFRYVAASWLGCIGSRWKTIPNSKGPELYSSLRPQAALLAPPTSAPRFSLALPLVPG
jgi:hypothetical protein